MRRAGKVVAEMHECCTRAAKPGATTMDVDAVARDVLERRGARSNFLNYHGFPAVVCTSPNEVIVHGIPSDDVVLEEGDILSIDCGAIIEGWHADAAITVPIGEIDDESKRLIEVTRASLEDAIEEIVAGQPARRHRRRGRGPCARGRLRRRAGVRRARHRHRDARGAAGPQLRAARPRPQAQGGPRARDRADGQRRRPEETQLLDDGWTVVTRDGERSAHFEHTIAVTEHGPEVLTLPW